MLQRFSAACPPSQCGQVCITAYSELNCATDGTNWWTEQTLIVDTGGRVTPFNFVLDIMDQVTSLRYTAPAENETNGSCPYIEYWFYDTDNKTIDFTLISPGQRQSPCISVNGSQIVAYSGSTVTETIPKDLLEWVDEGSP
jgi:hypothetical protein